jgi:hypothetical protein
LPKNTTIAVFTALVFLLLLPAIGLADEISATQATGKPADQTVVDDPWHITEWRLQTSLYTKHWDPDPEHNNHQKLIGIEAGFANRWRLGAAIFENSFYQNSQLLYAGKEWNFPGSKNAYFKLMGGLLHGYKDEYKNKIPFNNLGIAPVILPAIGYRFHGFNIEADFAGLAAVTILAGYSF